ncbi:hypothetical protein VUR80DRAFT_6319 [Thermomyces stellatus]
MGGESEDEDFTIHLVSIMGRGVGGLRGVEVGGVGRARRRLRISAISLLLRKYCCTARSLSSRLPRNPLNNVVGAETVNSRTESKWNSAKRARKSSRVGTGTGAGTGPELCIAGWKRFASLGGGAGDVRGAENPLGSRLFGEEERRSQQARDSSTEEGCGRGLASRAGMRIHLRAASD